ncbi:MAG: hypothetical protein CL912_33690 [Deltaproteobacteria bacterium]|nr:hypothetical protein [Deltaproteobacteria bacterium]
MTLTEISAALDTGKGESQQILPVSRPQPRQSFPNLINQNNKKSAHNPVCPVRVDALLITNTGIYTHRLAGSFPPAC